MDIKEYIKEQGQLVFASEDESRKARARVELANRIVNNLRETKRGSDVQLRARNRYQNDGGRVWLEENDWVYGMLTKAIRFAREENPELADRVYESCRALQRSIERRDMPDIVYYILQKKDYKDVVREVKRDLK